MTLFELESSVTTRIVEIFKEIRKLIYFFQNQMRRSKEMMTKCQDYKNDLHKTLSDCVQHAHKYGARTHICASGNSDWESPNKPFS